MTTTLAPTQPHRSTRRPRRGPMGARPGRPLRPGGHALLASHSDPEGRRREVVAIQGAGGSTLVVDRLAATGADGRLLAHLAADEPAVNAVLVCREYLRDPAPSARPLADEDRRRPPFMEDPHPVRFRPDADELRSQADGCAFRLGAAPTAGPTPELRWRRFDGSPGSAGRTVSLREVVATLEAYEPACSLTRAALSTPPRPVALALATLRQEHVRLSRSLIVLNRGLREAVLAATARGEISMSEIAIRCGRVKRDPHGNVSGETSWLARRVGLLPEGGRSTPTPWIHTEVLALIARHGLGVSPREVEL